MRRFCGSLPVRCRYAGEYLFIVPGQRGAVFLSLSLSVALSLKPEHIELKYFRDAVHSIESPHRDKRGTAKVASGVLKKGGEVASEVSGGARGFDFEGMRFGVKAWRASASNAREGGALSAPIVLVHGFAQQASTWDKVALSLSRAGVECFAFELAGHGKSARPTVGDVPGREAFDLCFQARALLAFCEAVAHVAGRLPVLVGYSMGGRVALQAACLVADDLRDGGQIDRIALRSSAAFAPCGRSGRLDVAGGGQRDTAATSADDAAWMSAAAPFSALVLESAGLGPADAASRGALRERNFAWAARVRGEGASAFMDWWAGLPLFESQQYLSADQRERLRAGRLANDAESLALSFEQAGAHQMPLRCESIRALCELSRRGVPVSYLAGRLDAKYCKVLADLRADSHDAVSCRAVPCAGHNIHLEQPEVFASLLKEG